MNTLPKICALLAIIALSACQQQVVEKDCPDATTAAVDYNLTPEIIEQLGITDTTKLSAASKRALLWDRSLTKDWFLNTKYTI